MADFNLQVLRKHQHLQLEWTGIPVFGKAAYEETVLYPTRSLNIPNSFSRSKLLLDSDKEKELNVCKQ